MKRTNTIQRIKSTSLPTIIWTNILLTTLGCSKFGTSSQFDNATKISNKLINLHDLYAKPELEPETLSSRPDLRNNINKRDHFGATPLYIVVSGTKTRREESSRPKKIKVLLQFGADVNLCYRNGKTLAHLMAEYWQDPMGDEEQAIWKMLVDNGLNLKKKDIDGRTPLLTAKQLDNKQMVELLCKYKGQKEEKARKNKKRKYLGYLGYFKRLVKNCKS